MASAEEWDLGCVKLPPPAGNHGLHPNSICIVLHGFLDCEHFPRLMLHYKKRKEIAISTRSLSLNSHNNEDARGTIFRLFSSLPPSRPPHLFSPKRSSPFLSLRSASHTPMGYARNGESGRPWLVRSTIVGTIIGAILSQADHPVLTSD